MQNPTKITLCMLLFRAVFYWNPANSINYWHDSLNIFYLFKFIQFSYFNNMCNSSICLHCEMSFEMSWTSFIFVQLKGMVEVQDYLFKFFYSTYNFIYKKKITHKNKIHVYYKSHFCEFLYIVQLISVIKIANEDTKAKIIAEN